MIGVGITINVYTYDGKLDRDDDLTFDLRRKEGKLMLTIVNVDGCDEYTLLFDDMVNVINILNDFDPEESA